jgi:23S rRNA pseudouridine1911/1915/1917 synthase
MGITKIEQITPVDKGRLTLILQILTGRTHQIRYHLSHHGLPIVGDYLYGKEDALPLQLTAYKLIYQDMDGSIQTIEI